MHATLLVRTALLELGKPFLGNQPEAGLIFSALKHTKFKKKYSYRFYCWALSLFFLVSCRKFFLAFRYDPCPALKVNIEIVKSFPNFHATFS
jgi:hypothetical protein